MDKISIFNLTEAISGYEDQFLNYALNRNTTAAEHERMGSEPHFNVSAPPSFYCKEIVQQMSLSDPSHFAQLVILFLRRCWGDGCFDAPDRELVEE